MTQDAKQAIVTNRGAVRARWGHPWIYRTDVEEVTGEPGDIVRVLYRRRSFLDRGFYNPKSEITLRTAERNDTPGRKLVPPPHREGRRLP